MAASDQSIAAAMQRLWTQYLPQLEERVAALEAAAVALSKNRLDDDLRASACSAAHKLAGVLGTFGLGEGTELAREAEGFYSSHTQTADSQADRLALIASRIRAMIALKK